MSRQPGGEAVPGNPGRDRWDEVMALFDRLLESDDWAATLAAEPDMEIREGAARLWEHHLAASREEFLEKTIEFTVAPVFAAGQVLLDRFEVEKMLGQGGMGEVYLARDRKLGELVALKTVSRVLASSPRMRRRFVAEVQNARRISHENVCRIHEIFDEGSAVFLVMEYVNGQPLDTLLAGGQLTSAEAREIVLQLGRGLQAAHRSGIVHGDFKPSNVLVEVGGRLRAVILDFGLARALRTESADAQGEEGLGAGTMEYMAPELAAGASPTVASDIFAFGKVARQLLPRERLWEPFLREAPGDRPDSLERAIEGLRQSSSRRYWLGGAAVALAAAGPVYSILSREEQGQRLESGARVLVNGFQAEEPAMKRARLVRAILITALQQSPLVRAIADQDLLPALRRMSPGHEFPVTGEVLSKLLEAQRASHWIDGTLTHAGERLSLVLRLWRTVDRRLQAEASFGDVPAAAALAEAAALWMRRLGGESRSSLLMNPSNVGAFTSAVPEALQSYYSGMEHYSTGQMELAVPLLEEALRLDPSFAQAENALAMCLNSQRKHAEAMEHVERARQLATKLPNRERAWVEAFYQQLTQDPVKMVEATRVNMDLHPDEPRFCRIYGQTLCWVGRAAESVPFFEKAVELSPQSDLLRNELVLALCEAGRFDEAMPMAEQARLKSRNGHLGRGAGLAMLGQGRYAEAHESFRDAPGDARMLQAGAKVLLGDVESAVVALRLELAAQKTEGNVAAAHRVHEFLCGAYYLTDRLDLARTQVRSMTALPEAPALGWQMQCTAFWAARLGEDEVLGSAARQLERLAAKWPNGGTHAWLMHARALQAWRKGDTQRAEAQLLEAHGSAFTIWTLFDLADYFTATSRPAIAEEYWRRFEERRGTVLRKWFSGVVLLGWLNRGIAAKQRGDQVVVSECASKVLKHWAGVYAESRLVQTARKLLVA